MGVPSYRGIRIPFLADELCTGTVRYVDSNSGVASDNNLGLDPVNEPCATWEGAYDKSSAGDLIILCSGHAETVTAAIALDTAGVTTIGVGSGDRRPTITVNAAVYGLTVTGHDQKFANIRVVAGSSAAAGTRLVAVAADDVVFSKCKFEMAYDMYHMLVVSSGDTVEFIDCEMINAVTTNASVHPHVAYLNIAGTNARVTRCYFNDMQAKKAERWRTCVEGGKLTADLKVEDCTFVCRGVATATRTAGASGEMATLYCRGVSPSSNTAVGSIFTPTYQFIIETYNVAAINKVGVVTVTTSDKRVKTDITYL